MRIVLLAIILFSCSFSMAQFVDAKRNYPSHTARHAILHANTSQVVNSYDMKYHRCEWMIDPANIFISGSVTSYFVSTVPSLSQVQLDFASAMTVDSVIYHGDTTSFSHANDLLGVTMPSLVGNGVLDSITVYYQGTPVSTGFGSFTQDSHLGIPIIATLSEPYGARDWWPCKQSLDDKIDSMDIIITTPVGNRAGTNGVLVSETTNGSNVTYHWQTRYPITAYLVGIAVTNYAAYSHFLPLGNDTLEILNYVYPEDSAFTVTQSPYILDVINLYDSLFIQYPFYLEKYGHCQWNWGGGEEHQTMSFVSDFNNSLIAHECAHQWFGDYITCGSFEDIWLNEGFATYSEALTREFLLPPVNWDYWKTSTRDHITSQPDGSVFCTDTTSVGRIFDSRLTYDKGGFILHMLRWKLGDSAFFQGVKNYLNDTSLAFGYARTSHLKTHLENASGIGLTNYFDQWFTGEGFPSYTINWFVDNGTLIVKLSQSQSDPSVLFFEMPIPVRFQDGTNDTTIVFDNIYSGEVFFVPLSFQPTNVTFDPQTWILAANNLISFDPSLGNEEINKRASLNVFPNPFNDKIYINSDKEELADITIRNAVGQIVLQTKKQLSLNTSLSVSDLATGVYYLNIITSRESTSCKLIKE